MKTPEERYRSDPYFHMLVDMIEGFYQKGEFSPSEIREAGTLACIHHEMKTVRPLRINVGPLGEGSEMVRRPGY